MKTKKNKLNYILHNDIKLTKKQSIKICKSLSIKLQNIESFTNKNKTKLHKNIKNINNIININNYYETHIYKDHSKYINGIDIIYWINLDRSNDRRKNMESIVSNFNIKNIRINASDGKLESDDNIYGKFTTDKFTMTKLEYACLLSHLNTIKQFSESNYEVALILEDDISLEFSIYWYKPISKIIKKAPKDWDIIMVGYLNVSNSKEIYSKNTDKNIILSTWSYIINKKSAIKFINSIYKNDKYYLTTNFAHQSDLFLYRMNNTYVYKYPYFTYRNNTISIIHEINFDFDKKNTIYQWKNYILEKVKINNKYNYQLNKNSKNIIEEEEIIENAYGFYSKYYYKSKNDIIIYYITKNNIQNVYIYFIYIFNKLKNKILMFKENILPKYELIKELNKVKKLKFILEYIK